MRVGVNNSLNQKEELVIPRLGIMRKDQQQRALRQDFSTFSSPHNFFHFSNTGRARAKRSTRSTRKRRPSGKDYINLIVTFLVEVGRRRLLIITCWLC